MCENVFFAENKANLTFSATLIPLSIQTQLHLLLYFQKKIE